MWTLQQKQQHASIMLPTYLAKQHKQNKIMQYNIVG